MRLPLLPLALAGAVLGGCPEERPGMQRKVSPEHFPPAVTVESAPADGRPSPRGALAPAAPAPGGAPDGGGVGPGETRYK